MWTQWSLIFLVHMSNVVIATKMDIELKIADLKCDDWP